MTHRVSFREVKAPDAFQMCMGTSTGWNEWWMGSDRSSEVGGRRLPFQWWCFLQVSTDLHARLNFSYFRLAGKPGAEESREGGLGPCCTCKEKGLGLMGPHTWVPLMLGRCWFPSLDLVEICAISTIRFCGQFGLTGLQCDGRKRRWTLLKECLRNVEPLQVWLFGCCKMLSY